MKILYHGSNLSIGEINLQKGRKGKDFGQGFYLSEDINQAKKMAEIVTEREEKGHPIVNCFSFDEALFADKKIKTLSFDSYNKDWAEFILLNRNNKSSRQAHHYDFVYGPIADEKVGVQIRLFTQELITIDALIKGLSFIKPTFQYFFGTNKAISYLEKMEEIIL